MAKLLSLTLALSALHACFAVDVQIKNWSASTHNEELTVTVHGADSTDVILLTRNSDLLAGDFMIESAGVATLPDPAVVGCHYHGTVAGAENSRAAFSTCGGKLEGFYIKEHGRTAVGPVVLAADGSGSGPAEEATLSAVQQRLVKGSSRRERPTEEALLEAYTTRRGLQVQKPEDSVVDPTTEVCYSEVDHQAIQDRPDYVSDVVWKGPVLALPCCEIEWVGNEQKDTCGTCTPSSGRKKVELTLVTDYDWSQSHSEGQARALSIFNGAAALFKDVFTPELSVVLSKLVMNEGGNSNYLKEASYTTCDLCADCPMPSASLPNFMDELELLENVKSYRFFNRGGQGDMTVMLTSIDLLDDAGCPGTNGLATQGKVCHNKQSAGVMEDFAGTAVGVSSEVLAHEMGHVLGAEFDGDNAVVRWAPEIKFNSCFPNLNIMAPYTEAGHPFTSWSECSKNAINGLMLTVQACCLQETSGPAPQYTPAPTAPVTAAPTDAPTAAPTDAPAPTVAPATADDDAAPTEGETGGSDGGETPTEAPADTPADTPTDAPAAPTDAPAAPTDAPAAPTDAPAAPTDAPTDPPTLPPTDAPTAAAPATNAPTDAPTEPLEVDDEAEAESSTASAIKAVVFGIVVAMWATLL